MDERRDPGEFYPGGRVIGRDGVAPAQTVVNWSDIQGKPDFSDVAELGEEATRGEMKQTMNTVINKLKTSLLIGALFVVGSAVADVEPLFAKADDIPGNQQIMTNTQEYVDAKVAGIPEPDFSTSNETLVATIEATAPAPGNYAAVSNAAMNALSRAEAEAGFTEWELSGLPSGASSLLLEWLPDIFPEHPWYIVFSYNGYAVEGSVNGDKDATNLVFNTNYPESTIVVTATRTRIPTMADLDGKASTNDVGAIRAQLDAATAALESHASQLSQQSQAIAAIGPAATNYTDSAIATADTSYRRVYSLTNLNQTVQFVQLDASQTSLAIELPSSGDTKDWLVYVYAANNVTLSLPSGVSWWTSDAANTMCSWESTSSAKDSTCPR